jgi:hypothetical protein
VVLFVPDLLDEVRQRMPEVEQGGGSWVVLEPDPRIAEPATPTVAPSPGSDAMSAARKGTAR